MYRKRIKQNQTKYTKKLCFTAVYYVIYWQHKHWTGWMDIEKQNHRSKNSSALSNWDIKYFFIKNFDFSLFFVLFKGPFKKVTKDLIVLDLIVERKFIQSESHDMKVIFRIWSQLHPSIRPIIFLLLEIDDGAIKMDSLRYIIDKLSRQSRSGSIVILAIQMQNTI